MPVYLNPIGVEVGLVPYQIRAIGTQDQGLVVSEQGVGLLPLSQGSKLDLYAEE